MRFAQRERAFLKSGLGLLGRICDKRKMPKRWNKLACGFALGIQLILGVTPTAAIALCYGIDGHFEIEAAHGSDVCHPPAANSLQDDAGCLDVPIPAFCAADSVKLPAATLHAVLLPVTNLPQPELAAAREYERASDTSPVFRTLVTIRTIVLLV